MADQALNADAERMRRLRATPEGKAKSRAHGRALLALKRQYPDLFEAIYRQEYLYELERIKREG